VKRLLLPLNVNRVNYLELKMKNKDIRNNQHHKEKLIRSRMFAFDLLVSDGFIPTADEADSQTRLAIFYKLMGDVAFDELYQKPEEKERSFKLFASIKHFCEQISEKKAILGLYLKPRQENNKFTAFHILGASIWPLLVSISLFSLTLSGVLYMSGRSNIFPLLAALVILLYYLKNWWYDVTAESGEHTKSIKDNIKMGMILFIASEVMFFFGFFWSYIHLSYEPDITIGLEWPSYSMEASIMNPYEVPLLNTLILLGSGTLITYVHLTMNYYIENVRSTLGLFQERSYMGFSSSRTIVALVLELMYKKYNSLKIYYKSRKVFLITLIFALLFTALQIYEYAEAIFNISDSVYGSLFYMMTGFHGFHVIVGTAFLMVNFIRDLYQNITYTKESVGLECAIWYWHFVDVVWICLYILLYWWPYAEGIKVDLEGLILSFEGYAEGKVVGIAESGQLGFQKPASTTMESIVNLHDYICFYLIIILFIVVVLMYKIIFHSRFKKIYNWIKRRQRRGKVIRFKLKIWYIKLYFNLIKEKLIKTKKQ